MIEWDSKDHSVLSFASSGTKSSLADGVSIHGLPGKPPHCLATSSLGKSSLQPSLAAHNSTGPLPRTLTEREVMKDPPETTDFISALFLEPLIILPQNKVPYNLQTTLGIFYVATQRLESDSIHLLELRLLGPPIKGSVSIKGSALCSWEYGHCQNPRLLSLPLALSLFIPAISLKIDSSEEASQPLPSVSLSRNHLIEKTWSMSGFSDRGKQTGP